MWIGQCRPLSISDSVLSTTQAGRPVNQRASCAEQPSPPSDFQPAADLVGDMVGLSVFRSSLASRLLRICLYLSVEQTGDSNFGRCRTPPPPPGCWFQPRPRPMSSTQAFAFIWRRFLPLMDFNGVWCRKYSTRLQPARLGLRRGLRFLRYLLGGCRCGGSVGRRLDGRWMTAGRSRKEIPRVWTVRNPAAFHPPRPPGPRQGIHRAGRNEV